MTDSIDPGLQILTTPKKRAAYRPAALRTNSHTRLSSLNPAAVPAGMNIAPSGQGAAASTSRLHRSDSIMSRISSGTSSSSPNDVTRDHWTPDSDASTCGACPTAFSFLERKHHCRRCGGIFCSAHSQYTVTLSPDASFSPTGVTARACPRCRREFELWMNPPNIRRPQVGQAGVGARPQKMGPGGLAQAARAGEEAADDLRGLPAASVPSDWTWSTF